MIHAAIQPSEAALLMYEHTTVILQMKTAKLDLNWAEEFLPSQLTGCCERIAVNFAAAEVHPVNIQRELIQNPEFAPWLARLADKAGSFQLGWYQLDDRLPGLLKACWDNERTITAYSANDVLTALSQERFSYHDQLIYLENFAPMDISCGQGMQLAKNLSACIGLPIELSDGQKALLAEPFVSGRFLFSAENFSEISELFDFCPELIEITRLLHQNDIEERLTLKDYRYFAEDAPEYLRLLGIVIQRLGQQASAAFIRHWMQNSCALPELRRVESRIRNADSQDWSETLATYSGYVNLIYGTRFKTMTLSELSSHQENILTYAIVHNKKHFIRLVDKNGDKFLSLPKYSILFRPALYKAHFNLNELTEKDLDDCARMSTGYLSDVLFTGDRQYTFAELKLLYKKPRAYVGLYILLKSESLDYRLKVLRQLLKRSALNGIGDEGELSVLAERLNRKPLHDWNRMEFGHIKGLAAEDTVKLLIHLDKLSHLLPDIRNRTDAMLALRSLDQAGQVDSMETLKAHLADNDPDWRALAKDMELTPEFKARYRDSIAEFLCQDGAGIAWSYSKQLMDDKQRTAFYRVVKAELMGRFAVLKYFEGDLERELGCSVPPQVKAEWPQNGALTGSGMNIQERDDFFSTILLGSQPYSTCLHYAGGAYCHCLLACFDSNKKVLYAERGGHIVGRACIRLTKCRITGKGKKEAASQFDFVDLEDIAGSREQKHDDEWVTLFLERPYISDVGPREQQEIETLFIAFARQKAKDMGTMLVLSMDYGKADLEGFAQTRLSVYISASKAGAQYLDSLGGQATVSDQGSYEGNRFLVDQVNRL